MDMFLDRWNLWEIFIKYKRTLMSTPQRRTRFWLHVHLTDMLNERSNVSLTVLDMGCGTGFLGLIAATHKNVTEVFLCDINKSAVSLAERIFNLNKEKISAQCHFMQSDLFSNVPKEKAFDALVFNTTSRRRTLRPPLPA